jgi:hypothetical protein
MPAPDVTARDVETYERDGVVCLRGVIAPHWIDVLAEGVEGSHRWQRWFQPELTRSGGDLYATGSPYERMPDIEAEREAYDIVAFDMQPGDCIVFHGLTVHGAPGNVSLDRRRRALSVIWLGDDTVFAARPGPVRPLFEGHGLTPGDPMDCDHFPRVWPRREGQHPSRSARFTDPGFRVSI